jgi:hypothetical protein
MLKVSKFLQPIMYAAEDALLYEASERFNKIYDLAYRSYLSGNILEEATLLVVVFIGYKFLPPSATSSALLGIACRLGTSDFDKIS